MCRFILLFALAVMAAPMALAADDRLAGYKPVDLTSWTPRSGPSAMELVEPLYRAHPSRLEGRPGLQITLRKDQDSKLVVDIEMTGYLDDSVAGSQFRAIIARTGGGWKLEALGERYICYRGLKAGQPTTQPCP